MVERDEQVSLARLQRVMLELTCRPGNSPNEIVGLQTGFLGQASKVHVGTHLLPWKFSI